MARSGRKSESRTKTPRTQVVRLPVMADDLPARPSGIRPSRMSRRRAWVLSIVQVLMILHIVQWLITGRTTTPIEPSESMEFVSDGIINAGLVFFALALLSTLIFGRWMCGWMCHLVLLQDLCGWIMKKFGVRPRPFRSRLLIWVPLLLALYMFVWPAVYRWGVVPLDARLGSELGGSHWFVSGYREMFALGGIDLPRANMPAWRARLDVTTDDFWQTFPGVAVAVPFLLICGFGCVYLLGAKGFCTYGCPYGGFFAPLDTLAVGRIRVTDDCEQCGHCTAVCTSNVRVSEEVNTYGMVVDPGCMKCMDCVSVCPNDALYFGYGKPAVSRTKDVTPLPRRFDLSWAEEIGLAIVFAICFFGFRGVYGHGMVPMLMAAGIAGCLTFLFHKTWRLWRDANVRLHKFQLKRDGRLSRSGGVLVTVAAMLAMLCLHSAVVRSAKGLASYHERKVRVVPAQVFTEQRMAIGPEMAEHARDALGLYRFASAIGHGGIGLLPLDQPDIDIRRAWLHATLGDLPAADAVLRDAIDAHGPIPTLCVWRFQLLTVLDPAQILPWLEHVLLEHESLEPLLDVAVRWSAVEGREQALLELCERRLERFPENLHTMRWLSILQVELGQYDEAIALTERTITIDPTSEGAYRNLAKAHERKRDFDAAEQALRRGLDAVDEPHSEQLHRSLGELLVRLGRGDEATPHFDAAARLRRERGG